MDIFYYGNKTAAVDHNYRLLLETGASFSGKGRCDMAWNSRGCRRAAPKGEQLGLTPLLVSKGPEQCPGGVLALTSCWHCQWSAQTPTRGTAISSWDGRELGV